MSSNLFFDSAADAARAAGVSGTTIIEQCKTGAIPGAYQSSDGWWRVPVDGMRAAGYEVTGEGAHAVGPYDRKLPEPERVDENGHAEWLGGSIAAVGDEVFVHVMGGGFYLPDEADSLAGALRAAAAHARKQVEK